MGTIFNPQYLNLPQQVQRNKNDIEQLKTDFIHQQIDDDLSLTSTNAVQNKVITQALDEKQDVMFSITQTQIDVLFN